MPRSAGLSKLTLSFLLSLAFCSAAAVADEENEEAEAPRIIKSHSFAARGEPKYAADFKHFDYVNPDAPKGGRIVLAAIGTYDSFNRYAQRGDAAAMTEELYDTLMVASDDEIGVYYPLITESLEYPEDYAWVIFNINPNARDQANKPITAEDVAFSFDQLMEQGVPFVRNNYKNIIQAEVLDKHRVKFHFETASRDDVLNLVNFPVFPKHYWHDRDLSEPLSKPPIGTGPYRISEFRMGQSVTFELLDDYWAADLPSRKGINNFKTMRYDYYRDTNVSLEAFKAGEYDFRQETVAKQWAEDYNVRAVTRGDIQRDELEHDIPQPAQGFTFNIQRELFTDRRVRQALNYALDFEWMNRNLFYSQYQRTFSYFQNTPYMAEGKPSERELSILEPFRDQLPDEVFGEVWVPNETDGSGNIRPALRNAMALLTEAGWELKDGKMVHSESGKPFEFELLIYTASGERVALPFKRNLERLGITMNLRQVDSTQFLNRMRSLDYDLVAQGYRANPFPHTNMRITWHSDYVDSTYNRAGVQDPVIDALIQGIEEHQHDDDWLLAYGHAFDRVARWNFYMVPNWHSSHFRIAYWNQFSRPEKRPDYDIGLNTWWFDNEKASRLNR